MTKEVLVTVTGVQSADGQGPIELVVPGRYYFRGGIHYLYYEECVDDSGEITRNFIRFSRDRADVRKKGLVGVNLLFVPGKKTVAPYRTPFGELRTEVYATEIILEESEEKIDYTIHYALSIAGETMEDCQVRLQIVPRT
ncbi:MAG: DUF1934 domain-containing protein [Bilifractor sp.]|jgi:uncharacterized beta-barrel protein YwiB (DUF1934 family)